MNWSEVQAWAGIAAVVVTITGFGLVFRQIALVRRTLNSQANAVLSDQSLSILQFIAANPETYDYLYNSKPLTSSDPNFVVVRCLCEMVANYADMVVAMMPDLHPDVAKRWERFITDTVSCSPALRDHFRDHRLWYSDEVLDLL